MKTIKHSTNNSKIYNYYKSSQIIDYQNDHLGSMPITLLMGSCIMLILLLRRLCCLILPDKRSYLNVCSTNSLIQQYAGRTIATLEHNYADSDPASYCFYSTSYCHVIGWFFKFYVRLQSVGIAD